MRQQGITRQRRRLCLALGTLWVLVGFLSPSSGLAKFFKPHGGSGDLAGGHTIGGPGLFSAKQGNDETVFDTDTPQPLCLTLQGDKGTAEARFDGVEEKLLDGHLRIPFDIFCNSYP